MHRNLLALQLSFVRFLHKIGKGSSDFSKPSFKYNYGGSPTKGDLRKIFYPKKAMNVNLGKPCEALPLEKAFKKSFDY